MDDAEFKQVYNQACDAAIGISDIDPAKAAASTQRTVLLLLQLVAGVQQAVEEMQLEVDDE